jgi:hypothetical protein
MAAPCRFSRAALWPAQVQNALAKKSFRGIREHSADGERVGNRVVPVTLLSPSSVFLRIEVLSSGDIPARHEGGGEK